MSESALIELVLGTIITALIALVGWLGSERFKVFNNENEDRKDDIKAIRSENRDQEERLRQTEYASVQYETRIKTLEQTVKQLQVGLDRKLSSSQFEAVRTAPRPIQREEISSPPPPPFRSKLPSRPR